MSFLSLVLTIIIIGVCILSKVSNNPTSHINKDITSQIEKEIKDKLENLGEVKYVMVLNKNISNNKEYIAIVGNELYYDLHDQKGVCLLDEVIDIYVSYKIKERNKLKVLTIVPTFDKETILQGISLTLHKEGEDLTLNLRGYLCYPEKFNKLKIMIENQLVRDNMNS